MRSCLTFCVVLCFITLTEQSCKVLTECENKGIDWMKLPHHGLKGQKGEPGFIEEVSNTGPEMHYISNTMTWYIGRAFCSMKNKRLCYARELCVYNNGGYKFLFDVIHGDNWVPVLDTDNEWVEIGDDLRRTCYVHSQQYGKPPWGTTTIARPYKGFIFCCGNKQDVEDIKYRYIGKMTTYQSSKQYCSSQGRRLCRINEVCQQDIPVFGVVNRDMWVAVSDRENEWVEIGNDGGRECWIHGPHYGPPEWGTRTDGRAVDHVGYVYCCSY